jgi:hypothetical protein
MCFLKDFQDEIQMSNQDSALKILSNSAQKVKIKSFQKDECFGKKISTKVDQKIGRFISSIREIL